MTVREGMPLPVAFTCTCPPPADPVDEAWNVQMKGYSRDHEDGKSR